MFTDTTKSRIGRMETILLVLIVALLTGHYGSTAGAPNFLREPDGYYHLQTAGFLQGHLYVAVQPQPGLLALSDPYDPVANAPYRVHDMTFWRGKYYLYFGVAPVLLLFLPVKVLTGFFVAEPTAVALFVSIGLAFASFALLEMRRRLYPQASPWVLLALVAAQGIAAPTMLLTQSPQFYQVPISCAYALAMAGLWCLQRVLTTEPVRRWRWMSLAGVCFGLTLAARPNYILAMGLLAIPLWWCWREAGLLKAAWEKKLPLALAAYGPAAAVGAGLLLFNWARFGHATEFGMRYQLAGQSFVDFTPLHWKYLGPHLTEYLWGKIWWQSYFPFLDLGPEAPYGVLRYLPLTWLGFLAFWPRRLPGEADVSARLMLASAIAILGGANLVMNSVFFFAPVARYLCDFAPALILLGAVGGLGLAQALPRRRWLTMIVVGAAVWSMMVTTGVFIYRLPAASYPTRLAHLANRAVGAVERLRGKKHGGVRLTVQLPAVRNPAMVEPIVQTGVKADRRDWLQLHYREGGRAQLGFFHAGLGELLSEEFALPADGRLMLDVYCSAFLPPDSHPLYDGWPAEAIAAARCKLEIKVENQTVLTAALPCYPSSRWDLLLGRIGFLPGAEDKVFAGKVTLIQELAMEQEKLPARELMGVAAPQSLRLQMPAHLDHGYEPLIATGEPGRGELLYVIYHPGHKAQFGLDSWGHGAILSRVVPFNPTKTQTMTVWLGSWAAAGDGKAGIDGLDQPGARRLYVKFDAEVMFNTEWQFFPGKGSPISLGWNRIGSGSAAPTFSGRILSAEPAKPGAVPELVQTGSYGAVDMWVGLPKSATGRTEPLIVTGEPGAGDALLISYRDAHHVVFRHDHWGRGGATSQPVRIAYGELAHIEISLGSLHARRDGPWSRRLWLKVNGQQIFDETTDFYPARPEQISLGLNSFGFSNCEPQFTGRILSIERPAVPSEQPVGGLNRSNGPRKSRSAR